VVYPEWNVSRGHMEIIIWINLVNDSMKGRENENGAAELAKTPEER